MNDDGGEQLERLVTIEFFVKNMLGYKSKVTYYNHIDDEGWPQRVWPGGKPMLVYSECLAYLERLKANRAPPAEPYVKPNKKNPGARQRHPGRPARLLRPPAFRS